MDKMKFPALFYIIGIITNLVRHFYLTIPSLILMILGVFGVPFCLLVGCILFALVLVLGIIDQIGIVHAAKTSTNPDFRNALNDLLHNRGAGLQSLMNDRVKYKSMSIEDLLALNDEELVYAVVERIDDRYDNPIYGAGHDSRMSEVERNVQAVFLFDLEYQNGGLCQYFVNSSRTTAPYLAEALRMVGADKCAEIYQSFLHENSIDPNDLDRFRCIKVDEYATKINLYPFSEVDLKLQQSFADEDPNKKLAAYVRAHISDL
jgi:hypothetical protein